MSTQLDKITEVLRWHEWVRTGYHDQPMCCRCQEGCSGENGHMLTMDPLDHPAHVAAAVLMCQPCNSRKGNRLEVSNG